MLAPLTGGQDILTGSPMGNPRTVSTTRFYVYPPAEGGAGTRIRLGDPPPWHPSGEIKRRIL